MKQQSLFRVNFHILRMTMYSFFISKMGLFGRSKKLHFGSCNYGKPQATPSKAKGRKTFIKEKGKLGGAITEVHQRQREFSSRVAFHWLTCDSLSLTELWPGKENLFLEIWKMVLSPMELSGISHQAGLMKFLSMLSQNSFSKSAWLAVQLCTGKKFSTQ